MNELKILPKLHGRLWLRVCFYSSWLLFFFAATIGLLRSNEVAARLINSLGVLPISIEGYKNIAMTLGLTGVISTWLLDRLEKTECGMTVSEMIERLFPEFIFQIAIFLLDVIGCVYFSSDTQKQADGVYLLALSALMLSMLLGLCSMWTLCRRFVFSKTGRREVAFACRKEDFENADDKQWKADEAYRCWLAEMTNIVANHEVCYARYILLRGKESCYTHKNTFNLTKWRITSYKELTQILGCVIPPVQVRLPSLICDSCWDCRRDCTILLAALFAAQADANHDQSRGQFDERERDELYAFLWDSIVEKLESHPKHYAMAICLYLTVIVIYESILSQGDNSTRMDNLKAISMIKNYGLHYTDNESVLELCEQSYREMSGMLCVVNNMPISPDLFKEYKSHLNECGFNNRS